MKRAILLACAATLLAAPAIAQENAKPVVQKGYKVPHLSWGAPDLQGEWTNATTSRLERAANLGDKKAYTKEEAAKIEGDTDARNRRLRAPTDQTKGVNQLDECQSGSQGAACGYNAGWTDPGDRLIRVNGEARTSMITFPANGRIPPRKAGAPAAPPVRRGGGEGDEGPSRPGQNDNPEGRSLGERCIMSFGSSSGPIMQSQLYNNNYQFVQSKDSVAMWVEMVHDVRIIPIGGKHRTDGVRPYMGDSIGWYEGDTLVVETINFHPRQQGIRGASPNVKVTERFTRVAKDRLLYQFKVEDPTVWDQAWGGEYEFLPSSGLVYEYACHEGNYGLQNILAGAREEEKEAAAKAKPVATR